MKNIYYTLNFILVVTLSLILSSCAGEERCCDEDVEVPVAVQVDTIYKQVEKVKMGPYNVQIGAFANKSNAEIFLSEAKSKLGSDVKISHLNDGIYRIIVGEYKSVEDAETMLKKVINLGFSDAFIRDASGPIK